MRSDLEREREGEIEREEAVRCGRNKRFGRERGEDFVTGEKIKSRREKRENERRELHVL